jgi:4-diphosphocytidyl-2-C-methyl-D-erythritol kinase
MTTGAKVEAQGKINLFLRILSREATGYHTIETLLQRIALADTVVVRPTRSGRTLDCRGADAGPVESNLAYRAAIAFAEATGWPNGFSIEIEKRIPVGGGLGGGSADAGAVLRALNALSPRPISRAAILAFAGALGSDVPFLALEAPLALAWGRGERMLELRPLAEAAVEAIAFPFGVSSADAYGWVAEARANGGEAVAPRSLSPGELASWEGVARLAENDFEHEVSRRHPSIAAALAHARFRNVPIAQLSGSGSTVFAIGAREPGGAFGEPGSGTRQFVTATAGSVEDVALFE